MTDSVNSPDHYNQGHLECIDAIGAATVGKSGIEAVCTANVIKYLWRYERKNGVEDVRKARWYLERLIKEFEETGSGAMTLPFDVSRCAARYGYDEDSEWCPMRLSCRRYMAFMREDADAGLTDYQRIPLFMGMPNCQHKIEVENDLPERPYRARD